MLTATAMQHHLRTAVPKPSMPFTVASLLTATWHSMATRADAPGTVWPRQHFVFSETHDRGVVQIEVHPRYPQTQLRNLCRQNGIAVVAYSSLGVGDLVQHPTVVQTGQEAQRTPAQVLCKHYMCQITQEPCDRAEGDV